MWRRGESGWVLLLAFSLFFLLASLRAHGQGTPLPIAPAPSSSQKANQLLDQLEKNSLAIENETLVLESQLGNAKDDLTKVSKALEESEVSRSKIELSLGQLENTLRTLSWRLEVFKTVVAIETVVIIIGIIAHFAR